MGSGSAKACSRLSLFEGFRARNANFEARSLGGDDLSAGASPAIGELAMTRLSAHVDARDGHSVGHSRRVRRLAVAIGLELGLRSDELESLGHAAAFHDIGKAAIPDEILLKPARLNESEWRLMQRHSVEGARMIASVRAFKSAVPAILHHHERYDGTGYPHGLAGDEIPLGARIVHLADAVDSMLSNRVYRRGRPGRLVLAEVRRKLGSQFCPVCVRALERLVAAGRLTDVGLPASVLVGSLRPGRP
jgi:HD-GYP domain-containing protein (c-di-GMP phosphodiesterase class II)